MKHLNFCLCLLLLLATPASAGDALDELLVALEPFARLSGAFTQEQYDDRGTSLGRSSGTFRLLRPDYFAWDIAAPDSQLVIAGPQFLWHHDRDLATVTRRRLDSSASITPLEILAADREAIARRLTVSREEGGFLLEPVPGEDVGFSRLRLRFTGDLVSGMEVLDNLGQRLVIEFSSLDLAPDLTEADFAFVPPPGADLFYHD